MAELSLPNILDNCIDRLAVGQSVAECLRAYPAQAATLRPMLDSGLAATQANFPAVEMMIAQERIWARMDAAFSTPVPSPRIIRFPRSWQWAMAAAAALLILVGVLYAAQNSQPGQPLYGVKVFINSILPGGEATPIATETPLPTATETPVPTETPSPEATEHVTGAIEGPVEAINGNVITIYGIEIIISGDDPLLDVIQVGDVIRVEGDFSGGSVTINVSDIIIVGAEDEVFTNDTGEVWRDDGTCNNPPPDWAVANGWRRRCEGGNGNVTPGSRGQGNGNGGSSGQGMGRGN